MKCLYCAGATSVTNSRLQRRSNSTWRRRLCQHCGQIFTTHEVADFGGALSFQTRDGSLQPFVREKLFMSLYESLRHKPNALDDAANLTHTVIAKLLPQISQAQLSRTQVVATTAQVLANYDQPAHVSYLAFHPLFS